MYLLEGHSVLSWNQLKQQWMHGWPGGSSIYPTNVRPADRVAMVWRISVVIMGELGMESRGGFIGVNGAVKKKQ